MSVKDKPYNSTEGLQLYQKETPTYIPVYIPKSKILVSEKNFKKRKLVERFPLL